MTIEELVDQIIRRYIDQKLVTVSRTKLTIPALGELQCLCGTQHHCEKHCTAGDHV